MHSYGQQKVKTKTLDPCNCHSAIGPLHSIQTYCDKFRPNSFVINLFFQ